MLGIEQKEQATDFWSIEGLIKNSVGVWSLAQNYEVSKGETKAKIAESNANAAASLAKSKQMTLLITALVIVVGAIALKRNKVV